MENIKRIKEQIYVPIRASKNSFIYYVLEQKYGANKFKNNTSRSAKKASSCLI